jgi:hypothetical protein
LPPANRVSQRVDHADGAWATGRRVAGVGPFNAALVLADVAGLAVGIADALWSTASDGVRFGDQTGLTPGKSFFFVLPSRNFWTYS